MSGTQAPSFEADITRNRKKVVWRKEECDRHEMTMRDKEAAGYWLISMPEHVGKMLASRGPGARPRGIMKICKSRKQGKKECMMHVRFEGEGVLPVRHCQMCGLADDSHGTKLCCKQKAVPWCSFDSLPYCEYCGTRLIGAQQCHECKTVEVQLLMSTQPADRPLIGITAAKTDKSYSYELDKTPVNDRLDMVVPEVLSSAGVQKMVIMKKTWKCSDCGTATQGKCVVTGKLHEPPVERKTEIENEEYERIDEELDFKFTKRPDDVVLANIVRAMQTAPDKKWNIISIGNAALENHKQVKYLVGKVAVKVDEMYYKLMPKHHKK